MQGMKNSQKMVPTSLWNFITCHLIASTIFKSEILDRAVASKRITVTKFAMSCKHRQREKTSGNKRLQGTKKSRKFDFVLIHLICSHSNFLKKNQVDDLIQPFRNYFWILIARLFRTWIASYPHLDSRGFGKKCICPKIQLEDKARHTLN